MSTRPCLSGSQQTALAKKKRDWIDFNAGQVLDGASFEEAADRLFELVLQVASGQKQTKNEEFGYREISIFRDGVIL